MRKKDKILIAGLDCTYAEAIREASRGTRIIIPQDAKESEDNTPRLELVNFPREEAKAFYQWAERQSVGKVEMATNYF